MSNKLLFTFLLTVFGCISSYAQDISVHGRVTDEKGGSVQGATVTVKGTRNATVTNDNGEFAINAKKGATLVITFVGYASKDYVVDGPTLNISLTSKSKELDEVVVTALGVKREKNQLAQRLRRLKVQI